MGREQLGLERQGRKRLAVVRRLHPQEPACPSQIHEIDARPQPRREPPTCVEERHRIERLVAEHREIKIAASAGFSTGLAAVEPGAEHALLRKRRSKFTKQRFTEPIERDHRSVNDKSGSGTSASDGRAEAVAASGLFQS